MVDAQHYWDQMYTERNASDVSWFQAEPLTSLNLVTQRSSNQSSVVDIGAGTSSLVDELLHRGYRDVTVLDAAESALGQVQRRLGGLAEVVSFIAADVTSWAPPRRYDIWHDRAVFHFMTAEESRSRYLAVMDAALESNGYVVLATFSEDGPETCSGLPVRRYSTEELVSTVGPRFELRSSQREIHTTPWGVPQPFTWVVLQKIGLG
jgi:SAM-dependent methyltransferase